MTLAYALWLTRPWMRGSRVPLLYGRWLQRARTLRALMRLVNDPALREALR